MYVYYIYDSGEPQHNVHTLDHIRLGLRKLKPIPDNPASRVVKPSRAKKKEISHYDDENAEKLGVF